MATEPQPARHLDSFDALVAGSNNPPQCEGHDDNTDPSSLDSCEKSPNSLASTSKGARVRDYANTSPSSASSLSATPSRCGAGRANLSEEAADFLSDLKNYMPLGCLCFEDFIKTEEHSDQAHWVDVTVFPELPSSSALLGVHVNKLMEAGWIRLHSRRSRCNRHFVILRVYILPWDVGQRFVDRHDKKLWLALECLISEIDPSPEAWNGLYEKNKATKFDMWATADQGSLFYMFNKLPSPAPSPEAVDERYAREALEDLLDPQSALSGLKTTLYPYQRRSAGLMLQRECVSSLGLDPRLERRTAPDGSRYCYGPKDLLFLRHPRYYEACRGGILAETMGLGKTVILLSVILATKYHLPKVPAAYNVPSRRSIVPRLADMAIANINRKSVPWKVEFDRIRHATGNDMASCVRRLSALPPSYDIPIPVQRWNRKTIQPPDKKMALASTTLIVVPRNLCKQWHSEIAKHVEEGMLRVLVMEDLRRALPPPDELRSYDVVLFSRNRFEMEIKDGSDEQGRRILTSQLACRCPYIGATRTRDCHCVRSDDLYDSPLKHLHFKRLVIDEGHFFSSNNTAAVAVANKLVVADHRWVVSGTPAKDLLGVEVDMSAADSMWQTPQTKDCRDAILEQRRHFSAKDDTSAAVKSLGSLASNFLKIQPWCVMDNGEGRAEWDDYIYRHESLRKRTFSGFSSCLQRTLEAMVVKTRPEDVERDIELPPLSHKVVRLDPSFFDKLTANLFTLVLTANAVTSERTDADYLFHKNSAKARYQLISNLRQSAFFWTGFSEADVEASIKNSTNYLSKEKTSSTEDDRRLLIETMACADTILASPGWKSMSRSHEIGLFVRDWPVESAEYWSFDASRSPLLTGVSQLLEAQKHVNERTALDDPGAGLAGAGIRSLAPARHGSVRDDDVGKKKIVKPILTKAGIPSSSLDGEPSKQRVSITARGAKMSPKKQTIPFKVVKVRKQQAVRKGSPLSVKGEDVIKANTSKTFGSPSRPSRERHIPETDSVELPQDSPFQTSRIVGTTSAKLSYLISQILKYYRHEKILVFYDGDNVAYYIAQMLELLHIKHEIYAKSLAAGLKSEYVVRFDQEAHDRVLLMNVEQAAFGLNLSSASRIYFVNPVCRPNIEAQAIKRAHRIGQTRKVFVETLVLKGSVEEKMLERSKRMTRAEHLDAKVLENDGGIREIIQSARLLPISGHELSGTGQMAALEEPQKLWGRDGWRDTVGSAMGGGRTSTKRRRMTALHDVTDPEEEARIVDKDEEPEPKAKRRVLAFVDCTDPSADGHVVEDDSDDEPIFDRWRRTSTPCGLIAQRALKPIKPGDAMALPVMQTETLGPTWSPLLTPAGSSSSRGDENPLYPTHDEPVKMEVIPGDEKQANFMREILRRL